MSEKLPDPPTNEKVSEKPKEVIVKKIPDVKVESKPEVKIVTESKPEVKKEKRSYTKTKGVVYGNPKIVNKSKVKNQSKPVIDKTIAVKNLPTTAKPNKTMFYVGLTIGCIIASIGIYALYKKLKEHIQSNKEMEALKEILNENEKEINSRASGVVNG